MQEVTLVYRRTGTIGFLSSSCECFNELCSATWIPAFNAGLMVLLGG